MAALKKAADQKLKKAAAAAATSDEEGENAEVGDDDGSPAPAPKPPPRARGTGRANAKQPERDVPDDAEEAEVLPPRNSARAKRGAAEVAGSQKEGRANGKAVQVAKKRRVEVESEEDVAAQESSPTPEGEGVAENVADEGDEESAEEEEVESLLLPSSQRPGKRPLVQEGEEDEVEDEVEDGEGTEEAVDVSTSKKNGKVVVRPPPSQADSVASLSDLKRQKKKARR